LTKAFRSIAPILLLGSWPFIAFLATNQGRGFLFMDVIEAWAVTVAVAGSVGIIATLAMRALSFERAGLLTGILCVIFFSFGGISQLLGMVNINLGTVWLLVWAGIFMGGGWLAWIATRRRITYPIVLTAAIVMVAIPTVEIAAGILRSDAEHLNFDSPISGTDQPSARTPHNVYWFLLDGYVRGDSLSTYFDHDNEPFLSSLEERGFAIARSSYSNFDNTTNSLSTTLSMDFVYLPGQEKPDPRTYTAILSGFNNVVRRFQDLDYRYIHAPYAGSSKTQCSGIEDRCVRANRTDRTPLSDVQVSLMQLTPLYRVVRKMFPETFTYDHLFIEDLGPELASHTSTPFFMFVHILAPHAPPRYTTECERLGDIAPTINIGEGVYDSSQFRTDTRCLNESAITIIDSILERDHSDPVIIMQGDHGFSFRMPDEAEAEWQVASDLSLQKRRLAILNVFRLPDSCRDFFYPAISPVNTFRLVFACLEDRVPDFMPDRHFVRAPVSGGYNLVEALKLQ
jgi:hypothetical protein